MTNTIKKAISLALAMIISLSVLTPVCLAVYSTPSSTDVTTVVYDFKNLGLGPQGTQPDFSMVNSACVETWYMTDGICIHPLKVGDYVDFNFIVPTDEVYDLSLQGRGTYRGVNGDLIIDGTAIGSYSFTTDPGSVKAPQGYGKWYLTAGTHTLTVRCASTNSYGALYMYPMNFIMTKKDDSYNYYYHILGLSGQEQQSDFRFIAISEVEISSDKMSMLPMQMAKLSVKEKLNNGEYEKQELLDISYESLNPEFATVSTNGAVTAVAPGSAQIKVTVYRKGVASSNTITLNILNESLETVILTPVNALISSFY